MMFPLRFPRRWHSLAWCTMLLSVLSLVPSIEAYENLWVYEPTTLVTDQAALDLDIQAIQQQLALKTNSGYAYAELLYSQGAFSKPVAKISLEQPLEVDLPMNTDVQGTAQASADMTGNSLAHEVLLTPLFPAYKGDQTLYLTYQPNEVQASYVGCQVGANPSPFIDGCLMSNGTIQFSPSDNESAETYYSYPYHYDLLQDNINNRTMQSLSTRALSTMETCESCPMPDYAKFREYYGVADYGDHIIQAVMDGNKTQFRNGNADFGLYGVVGRTEMYKKTMINMNLWMWIVRQMEHAIDRCVEGCAAEDETCFDESSLHAWDGAVAYYTGSQIGSATSTTGSTTTSQSVGNMLFHSAEKRCTQFATCGAYGDSTTGTSFVNHAIFNHFRNGQQRLSLGQCEDVIEDKERIVSFMAVPLIQGTLQYAHLLSDLTANSVTDETREKYSAQATAFAMSILPLVHDCSVEDANILWYELKPKSTTNNATTLDYALVKAALQRNYQCMNLECHHVGGLFDSLLGTYLPGATPCFSVAERRMQVSVMTAIYVVVGLAMVACLVAGILCCCPERARWKPKPLDTGASTFKVPSEEVDALPDDSNPDVTLEFA